MRQSNRTLAFWEKLKTVRQCTYHVQSHFLVKKRWNGQGKVVISQPSPTMVIFHERGSWQVAPAKNINFTNTFRWTLDPNKDLISLEHLRFGPDRPIFLFHLTPTANNLLVSVDAHRCQEDTYAATVHWDHHSIRLNWRVIGPKKNEELEYCYV